MGKVSARHVCLMSTDVTLERVGCDIMLTMQICGGINLCLCELLGGGSFRVQAYPARLSGHADLRSFGLVAL